MSDNFSNMNDLLHREADDILYNKELLSTLKKFGQPHITGSYALNLMTWRDLDIYLETENINEEIFFKLGAIIQNQLDPVKMSYRNERKDQTKGLPAGLYWGVYLGNERKGAWKIDIWAIEADECRQRLQFCNALAERITPSAKQIIFSIKSQCWQDPEYRRSYTSLDIYEAVLDKAVVSIEEFKKYLKEDRKE